MKIEDIVVYELYKVSIGEKESTPLYINDCSGIKNVIELYDVMIRDLHCLKKHYYVAVFFSNDYSMAELQYSKLPAIGVLRKDIENVKDVKKTQTKKTKKQN